MEIQTSKYSHKFTGHTSGYIIYKLLNGSVGGIQFALKLIAADYIKSDHVKAVAKACWEMMERKRGMTDLWENIQREIQLYMFTYDQYLIINMIRELLYNLLSNHKNLPKGLYESVEIH